MTRLGTMRRDEVLDYMREYHHREGIYPSVDEIAEGLKTVKSNIHYHLRELEKEGIVTHTPNVARSWRLTG